MFLKNMPLTSKVCGNNLHENIKKIYLVFSTERVKVCTRHRGMKLHTIITRRKSVATVQASTNVACIVGTPPSIPMTSFLKAEFLSSIYSND